MSLIFPLLLLLTKLPFPSLALLLRRRKFLEEGTRKRRGGEGGGEGESARVHATREYLDELSFFRGKVGKRKRERENE